MRPLGIGIALLAGALSCVGCGGGGPPKHVIKGKITNGGNPMLVKIDPATKAGGNLRISLFNEDVSKRTDVYTAVIDYDTGAFTLNGGDGRGIPAGKYKICVEWYDQYPGPDKLNERFSEENSKIIREIPPPDGALNIDVSKSEG